MSSGRQENYAMARRLLYLLLLCHAGAVMAGSANGHVTTITVANDTYVVLFHLDKPIENTPRCNESQRFSIHLQKPGGMAAYMAMLAAKQQGYTISVEGLNHCSNDWKSEDVRTITVN
jgi:hypothetical protein